MTLSPEHADAEFDWDHLRETHEIMYIVKRPAYEFCFAVPRQQANCTGKARPLIQVRFKDQCQMPGLVLEVSQMEDFFEGLSRLMEYVRAEAAKRAGEL
jgi:hypothetical protein